MSAIPIRPEWPVLAMLALTLNLCALLFISAMRSGHYQVASATLVSFLFGLTGFGMFYYRFVNPPEPTWGGRE